MLPLNASALLAALTKDDQPMLLYLVVGGIIAAAVFFRNIIGSVKDWRSLKAEDPADKFATRQELREVHGRVDGFMMSMTAEMNRKHGELMGELKAQRDSAEQHRASLHKDLGAIERSLGRLEGQEGIIEEHGRAIRDLQERNNGTGD
jgi:hypothetical protein